MIKRITAIYFSPTGNTEKVVRCIAEAAAAELDPAAPENEPATAEIVPTAGMVCPLRKGKDCLLMRTVNLTLPGARTAYQFSEEDLVVVGFPTYAGKLPNKLLPWMKEGLAGNGAQAITVVTYGNRSFDNSLAELVSVLRTAGFRVVAGAAFCCEHAFSAKLAGGRPSEGDLREAAAFGRKASTAAAARAALPVSDNPAQCVVVPGDADAPYYVPKGLDGAAAKFLKAVPKVRAEQCVHCGTCAAVCPMGSIDPVYPASMKGICIKCQACIHKCSEHARYFDDPAFLSHVAMLERDYQNPGENHLFY